MPNASRWTDDRCRTGMNGLVGSPEFAGGQDGFNGGRGRIWLARPLAFALAMLAMSIVAHASTDVPIARWLSPSTQSRDAAASPTPWLMAVRLRPCADFLKRTIAPARYRR